jgi:putative protein-disulfide isomerase
MQLYYVHDPMCSWCWAFRPVWTAITLGLPTHIEPRRLLGGLAPDTDAPMPEATRVFVQQNWRRIQEVVPGTEFNYDFWAQCKPRRSTYPACRAVIAAKNQGAHHEEPMILAIQQAYYQQARNPSDNETLIALASELGLDTVVFTADLNSTETKGRLLSEIEQGRRMGAHGFPSLILSDGDKNRLLDFNYKDASPVLEQLAR